MKHTFFDFLCSSLIPILCSDVTAGTSRNAHGIFILIAAVWTLPDQFSMRICNNLNFPVVSAAAAVIAFGI